MEFYNKAEAVAMYSLSLMTLTPILWDKWEKGSEVDISLVSTDVQSFSIYSLLLFLIVPEDQLNL